MEWEEFEKQIKEVMKPKDEAMAQIISEINGKYMDYESCKLLEKTIEAERDLWLKVLKKIYKKLKAKK